MDLKRSQRDSSKGFSNQKPFEIKELQERSHFSPPQTSEDQPSNDVSIQQKIQPEDNPKHETIPKQRQKQQNKPFQPNTNAQQKSISLPIYHQNSGLLSCQQTKKQDSELTIYIVLMYLGIFLYMCNFFLLMMPSLREMGKINKVTEIVLDVLFLLIVFVMIISYEKARRASPGYPIGLKEVYKVEKIQQVTTLPEIQELKSHTMSLLIKRAELNQAILKNPSQYNQQLFQSFEYKFFVTQTKWCEKCLNIKRPRVRHCSQCNRCIERMDHHCLWLNNCVGRRNHKFFMLFLLFLIIILTFFTVIGILDLAIKETGIPKYLEGKYGKLWKVVYIIAQIFATGLWLYYTFVFFEQLYLIFNNLTFVESLSEVLTEKKPWKKNSCCDNLRDALGSGCWICPIESPDLLFRQDQNKKNPSVELVEEGLGGNGGHISNFESQNHLKHERNQI